MTAQIIQFRDYQNPKDLERMRSQQHLEQMALEVMNAALNPLPFYESSVGYVAPEKDPA